MTAASRYRLLARLYLAEVDEETRQRLAASPDLAKLAPSPQALSGLRREYTHLFLVNVYPYESVFLDPSGLLNTDQTVGVAEAYARAGFDSPHLLRVGAVDHLGLELEFLAHLLETAGPARPFLEEHLLHWAPGFCLAVERAARSPTYRRLARATREALLGHYGKLGGGQIRRLPRHETPSLDQADLRGAVGFLIAPAHSGLFLSREDLRRLGQRLEVPLGIGERSRMLEQLLRAAGEFGLLRPLFEALIEEAGSWAEGYRRWSRDHPAWEPFAQAWLARLEATRVGLERLTEEAAGLDG